MNIARNILLPQLLAKKSHFLFGPRQTGKSWLIHQQLPDVKVYDLLLAKEFNRLNANPSLLSEEVFERESVSTL